MKQEKEFTVEIGVQFIELRKHLNFQEDLSRKPGLLDNFFDVSSYLLLTQDNLLTDGFRLSISHTLCLLSKRLYTVKGSSLNTRFD